VGGPQTPFYATNEVDVGTETVKKIMAFVSLNVHDSPYGKPTNPHVPFIRGDAMIMFDWHATDYSEGDQEVSQYLTKSHAVDINEVFPTDALGNCMRPIAKWVEYRMADRECRLPQGVVTDEAMEAFMQTPEYLHAMELREQMKNAWGVVLDRIIDVVRARIV